MKIRNRGEWMLGALAFVLVLAAPGAAVPQEPGDAPATPPAAVQALLDATRPDGGPVVGPDEHTAFDGLPAHARELIAGAVAGSLITAPAQIAELLALGLPIDKLELALQDNCLLCHTNPDIQEPTTLFTADPTAGEVPSHMNLGRVVDDVHFRRGLSCAGCHGGDPTGFMAHDFPDTWPADPAVRKADRSWIPGFCGRCHGDPAFMRSFDPGLPTDQLAKYRSSQHGIVLLERHDSRAAQCVSCHGVHGILGPRSPASTVHPTRIPDTCGACHASPEIMAGFTLADGSPMPTDQVAQYRTSVHGRALERGDIGVAVCNDCHGNHAAMPPGVASVTQICRTCHAGNGALFEGSKHKLAFEQHGWPECGTCHGNHAIAKTSDAMLGTTSPQAMCVDCHAVYARNNPECPATAAYFHDTITGLAAAAVEFRAQADHFAERGLDVEPLTELLVRLDDTVKHARSYIHTFDRSDFRQVADPGQETVTAMEEFVRRARSTYRGRRTGLIVSMVLIGSFALALYLRLRRYERRDGNRTDSSQDV